MEESTYEDWIKAGNIAAETLEYGRSLIKKGITMKEVCDACDNKIIKLGGIPAFPSQVSCNDIAAHFCPEEDDESAFEEQLVSLDVGACFKGAIGDNAVTVDLSGKYSDLIKASRDALDQALKIVQVGTTLSEIGKTVQETIQSHGFSPVRNLSGHGLGIYNIHDKPSIPNFDTGDSFQLSKGMKIAIEPFASMGKGIIYESSPATIFTLERKRPVRNPFARQALQEIESYKGLPFTTRWLTRKLGDMKTKIALRELNNLGILKGHPPLVDMSHGMVSQAEHTVLVDDKIRISTKL
ncbi:type II methionyl aminopeptidase [Candidatus Woesearchaeota archaeon]|nr:type II methionyl aminopeptidase [Candidatus Woesearchaeota archaeon]